MAAEIHRLRDKAGETEKITINVGYVDLGHIDLLVRKAFIPTVPTSFGPRSATGLRPMRRKSRNRLCGIRWSSDSATSPARIWRRSERPGKSCTLRCLDLPALPLMSRRNSPWRPLNQSRCWVRFMPVKKSRAR